MNIIPAYSPDPLMTAVAIAISGDSYSITGNADDQTNCIRLLWEFSTIWRPELLEELTVLKAVLHLNRPNIGVGSTKHLTTYCGIGVCEDVDPRIVGVPFGADYFWQGWRKNNTGHCGILRVPPAPDVGPSPKCVRIDARRDPPYVRETTFDELAGAYETFRLVRLRGRDGR